MHNSGIKVKQNYFLCFTEEKIVWGNVSYSAEMRKFYLKQTMEGGAKGYVVMIRSI